MVRDGLRAEAMPTIVAYRFQRNVAMCAVWSSDVHVTSWNARLCRCGQDVHVGSAQRKWTELEGCGKVGTGGDKLGRHKLDADIGTSEIGSRARG